MIYTNLEPMKPRPEKKRSTSTRKDITVKTNLEMNQDLNISNEVFFLVIIFLTSTCQAYIIHNK
jgi:hypothetical protein